MPMNLLSSAGELSVVTRPRPYYGCNYQNLDYLYVLQRCVESKAEG